MSENGEREDLIGDRNTKKVHFKDLDSGVENDMVVDSTPTLEISWRDKVLGRGAPDSGRDEDFEFLDGNVVRTTVNGVSAINFSERIQRILFRNMATTILINRAVQRVQFEALPFVCFPCGRFGHSKATCVEMGYSQNADDGMNTAMESLLEVVKAVEPLERFGPWMIVERKSRRNSRARINTETKIAMNNALNLFGIEKAEIREKEADVSGITFQKGEFLKGINQRSASTDKGNTGLITKTANIFSVLGKADVDGLDFLMEIEGQVDSGLMVEGPGMPIESLVDPK
ncbi:hypothetical protein Gorai_002985, partial [Gossypium raimondii]|nr:hypothetical protein [Gossypium raimondii]